MNLINENMEPGDRQFEEAAEWTARLESGDLDRQDSEAFSFWLAADHRHASAFKRMQEMLHLSAELDFSGSTDSAAAPSGLPVRPFYRHWLLAASVALVAVVAWLLTPITTYSIATESGNRQTLELGDGSSVTLRGDSSLEIDYTLTTRKVTLRQGEAVFRVTSNPLRRFVVNTEDIQIVAVGTVFNVAVFDNQPTVTLQEGEVDVSNIKLKDAETSPVVRLQTGQQIAWLPDGTRTPILNANLEEITAWQDGRIVLQRQPLQALADELKHTFSDNISIADRELASMTVNVSMLADERDLTFSRLEQQLPIAFRSSADGGFLIVREGD